MLPNHRETIRVKGQLRSYLERRRIGHRVYYLLDQLGGTGRERYRAFDPHSGYGGDFALVQRLPFGPETEARLRVLRRLKEHHFPRIWQWQRAGKFVDVALSWTEGIQLSDYLSGMRAGQNRHIDPSQAVRLFFGMVHGLRYLHRELQLVHGDIQPGNLILTSHPSKLLMIDFGSAWTTETTMFRTEGDGQQRAFAAPELQLGMTPVSAQADQFSLTAVLFQMLTDELPYGGLGGQAGRPEFIEAAAEGYESPSQLSARCRALPRSLRDELDQLCQRGLALDPRHRYPGDPAWLKVVTRVHNRFQVVRDDPWAFGLLQRVCRFFDRGRSTPRVEAHSGE